jgi:hypothetical protein
MSFFDQPGIPDGDEVDEGFFAAARMTKAQKRLKKMKEQRIKDRSHRWRRAEKKRAGWTPEMFEAEAERLAREVTQRVEAGEVTKDAA